MGILIPPGQIGTVVQSHADSFQVQNTSHPNTAGEHKLVVFHRNYCPDPKQKHQLIDTVGEETGNHTGDHLAPLSFVK